MAEFVEQSELDEFRSFFKATEEVLAEFEKRMLYDPVFAKGVESTDLIDQLRRIRMRINNFVDSSSGQGREKFKIQQR